MCKWCLLSDRETALGFIIFFTFFSRGKAFLYMRINASIWVIVHLILPNASLTLACRQLPVLGLGAR